MLYLVAGECVRSEPGKTHLPHLLALRGRLDGSASEPLRLFRERVIKLLADPSKYDSSLWREGSYAYMEREHGGQG